jgi:RHS repeat-associated protein
MRRVATYILLALLATSIEVQAQERPSQPGGQPGSGGVTAQAGGGGGGPTGPIITLIAPAPMPANFYNANPYIEIDWCDNSTVLVGSTRWIKLDGVTKTSSFTYQSATGGNCSGSHYNSTTSTVTIPLGVHTLSAYICNDELQCTQAAWLIERLAGPMPTVSITPYSPDLQDYGRCAVNCFAATYAQSTTPYFSLDTPRNVTLVYNGDRVDPRPFIHVDVTHGGDGSNALGRRQQLVTPHGATVRWFYDLDGWLRRVYATHTCVNGYAYCPVYDSAQADRRFAAYDRAGRPLIMSERVGNFALVDSSRFAYDAFGQMRSRWHNGRQRDYTYDLSGNITSEFYRVGTSSSGRTYTVASGHNRLIADTVWSQQGGVPTPRLRYLYMNAGERRLDSAIYDVKLIRRMWYDALGRMSSSQSVAVSQGTVVDVGDGGADTLYYTAISPTWYVDDCRYDALGRRVKACMGNHMLFDGDNPDFIGGFWPARIVYGPGVNDPLVVYYKDGGGWPYLQYFITDGGGRLISYTDSTGSDARVGVGHIYNEYASQAGAVNDAESFGGSGSEDLDQPDVSFFRNRYYDQRTGRWLTEDPIGVAGGVNLYQYVGNNPATYTDPFGLCPNCLAAALGAAVFGAVRVTVNAINDRPLGKLCISDSTACRELPYWCGS